jgi:hypothetical protein
MGQQQLLLIVLSVIIVGVSVVTGIQTFSSSAASSNQDAVITDLTKIGSDAQGWYRKPTMLGGGGNTYGAVTLTLLGYPTTPTDITGTYTTDNGTYTISARAAGQFVIDGVGNEDGDGDGTNVTVQMTVQPNNVAVAVTNR